MITAVLVLVALVVGAGAGYGYRGKINKGLAGAGSVTKSAVGQAAQAVQNEAKKL